MWIRQKKGSVLKKSVVFLRVEQWVWRLCCSDTDIRCTINTACFLCTKTAWQVLPQLHPLSKADSFSVLLFFFLSRVCVCVCVCVCLFSVQCESTCTWIDLPFSVKHWLNLFSNVHINMCYTGKCDFTSFKCLATGGKTTHIGVVQSMNNWYKVPSLC